MEQLQKPGREFTPIPFRFLNKDLRDAEIRRQLMDFAAHKVYGVVLVCGAKELSLKYPALEIEAEEMAQLAVNGKPAGVSFWSPHRFRLDGLLQEGSNELKLTVTGSPANRYGHPVWYGYKEQE